MSLAIPHDPDHLTRAIPGSPRTRSDSERLIGTILLDHRGRAAAIPMPELARAVDLSTRIVQDIVAHLIAEHAVLIGSATQPPAGYYLITDHADVEASVAQLQHRLASLARRIARIKRIAPEQVLGQLRMEI